MSSVYGHLMSTLPFQCALRGMVITSNIVHRARQRGDRRASSIDTGTFAMFRRYVQALDNDTTFRSPTPRIPRAGTSRSVARVWRFTHDASTPSRVTNIECRVRGASYRAYRVLDNLDWGTEVGGSLRRVVRVTTYEGRVLNLPLDNEHLFCRFHVKGGVNLRGQSSLFPLRTYFDRGLVLAFAYELPTTANGTVQPFTGDQAADDAADELGRGRTSDAETWFRRLTRGSFMAEPDALADFGRLLIGMEPERRVSVRRPRVLVCLSLSLCREYSDFEPGGVIGAARLYPHLMVKTSGRLRKIEGSVRYDRPSRTTQVRMTRADANISGSAGCHEANDTISAIYVADQNDSHPLTSDAPAWPALFSYAQDHAEDHLLNQRLHMVRRENRHASTIENCGIRTSALLRRHFRDIRKVARQGEFDNIHLAPTLRLNATGYRGRDYTSDSREPGVAGRPRLQTFPVNAASWHLNDITMAPFCEHDCFHTHWRWGSHVAPQSVCGYGTGNTPYTVPGATMVRRNQDVWVRLRSAHAFTYEAHIFPNVRERQGSRDVWYISTHDWHVIMHHGSAYAQAVLRRWGTEALANFASSTGLAVYNAGEFVDARGNALTPHNSRACFYWSMRYGVEIANGRARAVERIRFTPRELLTARRHPSSGGGS